MDSEKDEQPKKSLKTLHLYAKPAGEPPEREQVIEPISPHILDMMRPQSPPKPISMRLADIHKKTDDELMKWLTTEAEHPGRPLDDGTKMAITAELMRRNSKPHAPSFALLVASVVIALVGLGYSIWQGQQTKSSPPDSAAAPQTTQPAASAAR